MLYLARHSRWNFSFFSQDNPKSGPQTEIQVAPCDLSVNIIVEKFRNTSSNNLLVYRSCRAYELDDLINSKQW
jgi:hypothetical protein